MNSYKLRPAQEKDLELCFRITEDSMRTYVEAIWGKWEPDSQREAHAKSFKATTHQIIEISGEDAGLLAIEESPTQIQLEKLYLFSQFRNQGIGCQIIEDLQNRARALNKPVRLRTLQSNLPAQRFYLRHGFVVTETTKERCFFEWIPDKYTSLE